MVKQNLFCLTIGYEVFMLKLYLESVAELGFRLICRTLQSDVWLIANEIT